MKFYNDAAQVDNWDLHWSKYEKAAELNPAQRFRHQIIIGQIEKYYEKTANARILDIGSGQGDLLRKIRDVFPKAHLVGFELSEVGVKISQQKVSEADFYCVNIYCPSAEIKVKFHKWASIAICSEVLEHQDDPIEFLRSIKQFMADDSLLILTVPGGPISSFDKDIGHRQHFTRNTLSEVLEKSGYTILKIFRCGFPFFLVYRVLVVLRGDKLRNDVVFNEKALTFKLLAKTFEYLFKFNLPDSPLGWQLLAIARKD